MTRRPGRGLVSRWVAAVGILGTVLLAAGAFSLSFTSLTHLAVRAGIDPAQAWEWPLIVDGVIVVATVSVVTLAGRQGTGYAWTLLIGGALVSVCCNALQASRMDTQESSWMAGFVATIPPVVLLAATHMTVILTRPQPSQTHGQDPIPAPPSRAGSCSTRSMPDTATSDAGNPPAHTDPMLDAASPTEPDRLDSDDLDPGQTDTDEMDAGEMDGGCGEQPRTSRVVEARQLQADGFTVPQIAHVLGVSTGSVRRYLKTSTTDLIGEPE